IRSSSQMFIFPQWRFLPTDSAEEAKRRGALAERVQKWGTWIFENNPPRILSVQEWLSASFCHGLCWKVPLQRISRLGLPFEVK
ncbi:MAG: hypothetical protein KGQ89_08370, partial [Verrucomicrobia bacterium]|nr:hypothetical protein [Verrucomicrobiota bacterium]